MGVVYRARDERLRRDVAVKVLHPSLAGPQYLERLSREARAAASLNHPNIVAVFDVCLDGSIPYVVTELLEGESLRERLDRGPTPYRKALEFGGQISQALAAAHAKNICHRDLKPANIFVTAEGQVKLLDFGLAKVEPAVPAFDTKEPTAEGITRPGVAMGTVGYMAPEQVVGGPVDSRTDIFAFGALLYEMLTGQPAFRRATPVETMNAVLHEEPPDALTFNPNLSAAAAAVVRRCLEKNPEERFQSARDLAFQLRQLEQGTTGVHVPPPRRARLLLGATGLGALAMALAVFWPALTPREAPVFRQVAYHRGSISGARFAAQGIVYSQASTGGDPEIWLSIEDGPESQPLGYKAAEVLAARANELAISLHRRVRGGDRFIGTLARTPIGGTPREVLEDVEDADWGMSGAEFAVARSSGIAAGSRLEYPIERVLYHAEGSIHSLRISRDGRRVAFLEDPKGLGAGGRVVVVTREGESKTLTGEWSSDEIWFTAAAANSNRALRAVDLAGRERVVLEAPGSLTIWDASPDGRVLLTRDERTRSIVGVPPGETLERDLSWFETETTGLAGLSPDGQWLVFGDRFGIYVRRTNGDPPVKLGLDGAWADALSPDGSLVLATSAATDRLWLVPTGAGSPRALQSGGIRSYAGALFFPDGRRILLNGRAANRKLRSYIMDNVQSSPRALTSEGTWALSVSPDGTAAAAIEPETGISIWPTAGGEPRLVRGSQPGDRPVAWTADGGALWVFRRGEVPASIHRLEIASGRRTLWKKVAPSDLAGVHSIADFYITPAGHSYFYSFERVLSQLYVARGLR
jgi:eukaryotic-like serine/threonine-protein kinase